MIVGPFVFVVLEGLLRLELSLGLASSLLLKKLFQKRIFVVTYVAFTAVEKKAIFLCYFH